MIRIIRNNLNCISILGLGWLGLPLAKSLSNQNFIVKGSQTKAFKNEQKSILTYNFNIPTEKDTSWLTKENEDFFKSDILIITLPFKRYFDPPSQYLEQIKNCIVASKKYSQIKHIIFTSSTAIYPDKDTPWKENDEICNSNNRSRTLLGIETALLNIKGISSTILRLGGLYGPNRVPGRFIKKSTKNINGSEFVNLTHLNDCINAIQTVIKENIWNEIFNIVSGEHPSKVEFYNRQAKNLNISPPQFLNSISTGKIISNTKSIKY